MNILTAEETPVNIRRQLCKAGCHFLLCPKLAVWREVELPSAWISSLLKAAAFELCMQEWWHENLVRVVEGVILMYRML